VLHAFAHQWPCQCVYHPRKREGFGFTDGEGCERCWSSLKKLIPVLRVSGVCSAWLLILVRVSLTSCMQHHRRLYLLDVQVSQMDQQSLWDLGSWLYRRHRTASMRLEEALRNLSLLGLSVEDLRASWRDQVTEQTKPLPGEYMGMIALYVAHQSFGAVSRPNLVSAAVDNLVQMMDHESRCIGAN
jgi:hypothetical protein